MKVVFVEWTLESFRSKRKLTLGKTYDVISSDSTYTQFVIKDDDGKNGWYPKGMFRRLDELRQEKLKELGI